MHMIYRYYNDDRSGRNRYTILLLCRYTVYTSGKIGFIYHIRMCLNCIILYYNILHSTSTRRKTAIHKHNIM